MPIVTVHKPADTAFPAPLVLECNGNKATVPYGAPVDLDPEFIEVLRNSSLSFDELDAPEAAAAGEPGGEIGGSASEPPPVPKSAKAKKAAAAKPVE
jgi:hypothetical protein